MRLRAAAFAALACLAPTAARAQGAAPSPAPVAGVTVAVLPLRGRATQDLLDHAAAAVRDVLTRRGARVVDPVAVQMSMGVAVPSDPRSAAGLGRNLGARYVLFGHVQPFAGQFNLTLTLVEVSSARSAERADNLGDADAPAVLGRMLDALLDPASLGAAPVDPEEARRREEAEARARAEAEARQREEAARRQREEAARRQREEAAHPLRRFDELGPVGLGVSLAPGGVASTTRPNASAFALALRFEASYALRAVAGLEVLAQAGLFTTPSTAFGLGAGAAFTFPASSRGALRGTGGATVGLFKGLSGAQVTTAWISVFARAEWSFTPRVAAFAGLALDVAPADNGGLTTLSGLAGVRLRVGN